MKHLTSKPGLTDTIKASHPLPALRFVRVNGALCGAGERAWGTTELAFAENEYAGVVVSGIVIVESGGAIPLGAAVTSDSNGRAVVATGSAQVNGWAGSVATAAGDFVAIKLA